MSILRRGEDRINLVGTHRDTAGERFTTDGRRGRMILLAGPKRKRLMGLSSLAQRGTVSISLRRAGSV